MQDFSVIANRTRKITAALYRVTHLMPSEEPLKWSLRESAVKILDVLSSWDEDDSLDRKAQNGERLERLCSLLVEKLFVAGSSSMISRVNFDVLRREYQKTYEEIRHVQHTLLKISAGIVNDLEDKSIEDKNIESIDKTNETPVSESMHKKEEITRKKGGVADGVNNNNNTRRERLLFCLKGKEWLSMSEINDLCGQSVSKKTLQRDINELLATGFVKSEGRMRWKRYAAF